MYRKTFLLLAVLLGVGACTAVDPSVNDLKSPCVSNDDDPSSPCVRRKPLENFIA